MKGNECLAGTHLCLLSQGLLQSRYGGICCHPQMRKQVQEFMTVAHGQMADNGEARLGAQLCQILRPFFHSPSLRAVFYENVFTCVL